MSTVSRLAVVTGGSSGIGLEIARELARRGHPVLAVARRADRLQELADEARRAGWPPVVPLALDLTTPGAEQEVAGRARALGGARWLVNCAGFAQLQPFVDSDPRALAEMIQLDVAAVVLLTRALLPQLLATPGARVLNVASLAGLTPCPWFAAYGASKAFVVSFSEALAEELRGRVTVTAFCPGPVRTEIFDAGAPGVRRRERLHDLDAAGAARAAVAAAERGAVVAVAGAINRLAAVAVALSPRGLVRRLSRTLAIRYIGFEPPAEP